MLSILIIACVYVILLLGFSFPLINIIFFSLKPDRIKKIFFFFFLKSFGHLTLRRKSLLFQKSYSPLQNTDFKFKIGLLWSVAY